MVGSCPGRICCCICWARAFFRARWFRPFISSWSCNKIKYYFSAFSTQILENKSWNHNKILTGWSPRLLMQVVSSTNERTLTLASEQDVEENDFKIFHFCAVPSKQYHESLIKVQFRRKPCIFDTLLYKQYFCCHPVNQVKLCLTFKCCGGWKYLQAGFSLLHRPCNQQIRIN